MAPLFCALEALVALAVICLVLYVLWWALTSILGAWGVALPPPVVTLLRVLAVLILVIVLLRLLLTGEWCVFGWTLKPR